MQRFESRQEGLGVKITRIDAIPFSIPLVKPSNKEKKKWTTSLGSVEKANNVLVKLYTDEDIIGIGECSPSVSYLSEEQADVVCTITNLLAPVIVGEDPFNIEKIVMRMEKAAYGKWCSKAGIDFALYDIMGKALGVPACQLLGGRSVDKLPHEYEITMGSIEEMVEEASWAIREGYCKGLKVKVGIDPDRDVKALRAIRDKVGDEIAIIPDFNQGVKPYNTASFAIRYIRKMHEVNPLFVEQPVPGWDLYGMAKVAEAVDTPICADESVRSPYDMCTIIRLQAAEVISVKLQKLGGIYWGKRVAEMAELAGIQAHAATMLDSSVGGSAVVHFALCTPNANRFPIETTHRYLADDTTVEPLEIRDGYVDVPEKAGLGIRIDEEKIEKYRVKAQ
jgi:L-alanine-DL-glutamate epimerase-like enolase superfamily enzyme